MDLLFDAPILADLNLELVRWLNTCSHDRVKLLGRYQPRISKLVLVVNLLSLSLSRHV